MKRCPTCGNTYTNDALVFCLEDGATLAAVGSARPSFDPEATLKISAEENALPPTVASRPQGAQTFRQPPPHPTVPPQAGRATGDNPAPPPAAAAPAPAQRSTSPVVVAGITAIVVLLLVIAGLGIALLVRNSSQGGEATANVNNNRAADGEANRNSSGTVNDNGGNASNGSANKTGANASNRNATTATDSFGRAESKVVRGALLDGSELAALSGEQLRRLRNTVYARHGRTFDSVDLQRYFDSRSWYKPRPDYNEAALTSTDLANIKLIQTVENSR
jgi:hypothetical protein